MVGQLNRINLHSIRCLWICHVHLKAHLTDINLAIYVLFYYHFLVKNTCSLLLNAVAEGADLGKILEGMETIPSTH